MKDLKEMSLEELSAYWTGTALMGLGRGESLRSIIGEIVRVTQMHAYERGKTDAESKLVAPTVTDAFRAAADIEAETAAYKIGDRLMCAGVEFVIAAWSVGGQWLVKRQDGKGCAWYTVEQLDFHFERLSSEEALLNDCDAPAHPSPRERAQRQLDEWKAKPEKPRWVAVYDSGGVWPASAPDEVWNVYRTYPIDSAAAEDALVKFYESQGDRS